MFSGIGLIGALASILASLLVSPASPEQKESEPAQVAAEAGTAPGPPPARSPRSRGPPRSGALRSTSSWPASGRSLAALRVAIAGLASPPPDVARVAGRSAALRCLIRETATPLGARSGDQPPNVSASRSSRRNVRCATRTQHRRDREQHRARHQHRPVIAVELLELPQPHGQRRPVVRAAGRATVR